jgi:hypothetical protein
MVWFHFGEKDLVKMQIFKFKPFFISPAIAWQVYNVSLCPAAKKRDGPKTTTLVIITCQLPSDGKYRHYF